MIALYILLPLALLVAGAAVGAFIWNVRSGQLDDLDTPPRRMLFDDELDDQRDRSQESTSPAFRSGGNTG
jgi:cbb3-type cytochrome oxidase maturation protein